MSSLPAKWYWNRDQKIIQNSNGIQVKDQDLLPGATFGQKFRVNLQIVTDTDNTAYTGYESGTTAEILADKDYDNPPPIIPLFGDSAGSWTQSTNDTAEYYYTAETISAKPQAVWINGTKATEGTPGSLSDGEWGWGNTEGSDTDYLYVELSGDADPDTESDGYVEYQPSGSGTQPFVTVDGTTIQESGTWYDESTSSWKDPDITKGQISFYVNANTTAFYERLNGASSDSDVKMQVQMLDSTSTFMELHEFQFPCKNRMLSDTSPLDVETLQVFTKSESDARYLQEAKNLSDLDSAPTARTYLGVEIGTDVQAYHADLDILSGKVTAASPEYPLYDSDTADGDKSAAFTAQATATSSGSEDIDVRLKQQIAGTMTTFLYSDADGVLEIGDGSRDAKLMNALDMNNQTLKNVPDPTADGHAANRGWVIGYMADKDFQESIISFTDVSAVGSPGEGDRYIDNTGASGFTQWDIYTYRDGAWEHVTPDAWTRVTNEADSKEYVWNGSSWVLGGGTVDHGQLLGRDDPADHLWAALKDGSRTMTGSQDYGGFKVQNLGHATTMTDAVTPRVMTLSSPQSTISDTGALTLKRWTAGADESLRVYRGGLANSAGNRPAGLVIRLNNHTDGTQTDLIDALEESPVTDTDIAGDDVSIEIYNGTGGSVDAIGDIEVAVV